MLIGVVGDAMTDRWVFGRIERISPEADCPVFVEERTEEHPGGAAHVAACVERLGAKAILGSDRSKRTVKTRYVGRQQVFRTDIEDCSPINPADEDELYGYMTCQDLDALILSDYDKGVFKGNLARRLINWANAKRIPVIVDPKGPWSRYALADVITPNTKELKGAKPADLCRQYGFKWVVETRGERGIALHDERGLQFELPAVCKRAVDVTGAGDVIVASFAVDMASGEGGRRAAHAANQFAAQHVTKWGTR